MGESVQQYGCKLQNQECEMQCLPWIPHIPHIIAQEGDGIEEEQAGGGKVTDVCLQQVRVGEESRAG